MEDSFGCSSNELAVARRWQFVHAQGITGGLLLGIAAAHRCTAPTIEHRLSYRAWVRVGTPPPAVLWQLFDSSPTTYDVSCRPLGQVPNLTPRCTLSKLEQLRAVVILPNPARWVFGLAPGFYLDLGSRVRLEATLIRSPWTGHHIVAYAQLLIRLATFR